ncbi:xanthine dehydrogenase family protein subunit M [Brevibacterium sp. 5221]|uniref:Xanthine dehydrogenase family protein subunit M n=1 Tax=Brevibacterium rongguiense TaxID=2695267 RepID=A0A6N9H3B2_9MICO|nr:MULTISPECIES: FAD binding domain-containing protein [Brevibacterium]MYM18527.1 xanthine dehydrogenase family protein subunit M [Brevibacterium rongguiense]WAL39601.1 FAD binding domain-containing protein [Brevibacterium sp. BRM-1]
MKPSPFTMHRPTTLDEALELLRAYGAKGKVIAGGQSLVPVLNMRLAAPEHLIDITALTGLDGISVAEGSVEVGALVTHRRLERSPEARAAQPLLRAALGCVAHPAIRNRGTTVGSLAHADPNGEMPAILALTGGWVTARGDSGERRIGWEDFNVGPLETSLEPHELLTSATFPALAPGQRGGFKELTRRTGDYALAGVGMILTIENETMTGLRASFVSVTDMPVVVDLGEAVAGVPVAAADSAAPAVAAAVEACVDPVGDIHATADYRRRLAGVLAGRLLEELAQPPAGSAQPRDSLAPAEGAA